MKFYERYINGQTEQVYQDISALGQNAFLPGNFPDIEKVLTETFQRVAYNLDIIYTELKNINYLFKTEFEYNFQRPLHEPLPETDALLKKLDKAVEPYGHVPLSLKIFYKIVGGVNFVWDYETNENLMWNMADPIQVVSLDSLVNEVDNDDWKENMEEYISDCDDQNVSLELVADDLHKDNVSGGLPYSLEITKPPSIDSNFINEPNETTFINYLRICFKFCGFPGIARPDMSNEYQTFFDKVKPQLKSI